MVAPRSPHLRRPRQLGWREEDWLRPGESSHLPLQSPPYRQRTRTSKRRYQPAASISPVISELSSPGGAGSDSSYTSPYASRPAELMLLEATSPVRRQRHRGHTAEQWCGACGSESETVSSDAERAASHCRRAERLAGAGRYTEAKRHFDSAVRLAPWVSRYWQRRAEARRREGDQQGAVGDRAVALALDFEGLATIHSQLLPPGRGHQRQKPWSRRSPNEELWRTVAKDELSTAAQAFRDREDARIQERRRLQCARAPCYTEFPTSAMSHRGHTTQQPAVARRCGLTTALVHVLGRHAGLPSRPAQRVKRGTERRESRIGLIRPRCSAYSMSGCVHAQAQ